jgi:predicted transcriptional regulator
MNTERSTEVGYTTALKMLQVMTNKGLVERDESQRPQVYRARLSQEQTQMQLVRNLVDRAFGGSAKRLVMQALTSQEASESELEQVERLLDQIEENKA